MIAGSGRVKLDDEIVDIAKRDAVRVAPGVMRVVRGRTPTGSRCSRSAPTTRATARSSRAGGPTRRSWSWKHAAHRARGDDVFARMHDNDAHARVCVSDVGIRGRLRHCARRRAARRGSPRRPHTRARTSADPSPTPPLKTIASSPPSATAHRPDRARDAVAVDVERELRGRLGRALELLHARRET